MLSIDLSSFLSLRGSLAEWYYFVVFVLRSFAGPKRQIQILLKFAPNKTRQLVSTQISVTTKLAATEAIDTQMIIISFCVWSFPLR